VTLVRSGDPSRRISRARRAASLACRTAFGFLAFGGVLGAFSGSAFAAVTTPPNFVYAEAVRGHIVVVNWEQTDSAEPEPVTYRVYRAEGDTMPVLTSPDWSVVGIATGRLNTSFVDDSAKKTSTRYWYVVSAQSSGNTESGKSPFVTAPWSTSQLTSLYAPTSNADSYQWYISTKTLAPLPPDEVVLSGADGTIELEWSPSESTNEIEYRIHRSTESGTDGVLVATITATTPSSTATMTYSDAGIEMYRHYWYRIEVADAVAVGYRSVEQHFRTVSSAQPPEPHGGGPGDDTCSVCHDAHCAATQENLLCSTLPTDEFCLTCHDGTGSQYDVHREFTDPALSSHEISVFGGTFECGDCHAQHGDPISSPKLLSVSGETSGTATCYGDGCHGSAGSTHWAGDMSGFESSVHKTDIPDPPSGTKNQCSTCHMPHASPNPALWTLSSYRACVQCHRSDRIDLASPDIYTRMTANADHDSHHDVLQRDQDSNGTFIACQNCHNTHAVTDARPLVDPHDPSMAGMWPDETGIGLKVDAGTVDAPRYNGFCLACHDNAWPTALETGNWVDPPDFGTVANPNLLTQFTTNNHGAGVGQGNPGLHADSGYGYNDALSCMTCHEPHGTVNNYNLREDVLMSDGTSPRHGRMLVRIVTDIDGTPDPGKVFDTRFFCSSCHDFDIHDATSYPRRHDGTSHGAGGANKNLRVFPTTCTAKSCHAHDSSTSKMF
jgi:predicted CXXCH cytochrome family protein